MNLDNLVKLRSYTPQEFSTGEEYVKAKQMHLSTTWATEVELFACAAVWEGCCLLFWQTVAEIPCKW